MRIYICDDNPNDIKQLTNYINKFVLNKSCYCTINSFNSGKELLDSFNFNETNYPDIIFLDIYMNDILGIDVAKELYSKEYKGIIIFTTTSLDFAVESYKLNADGYLCKPFTYDEFFKSFNKSFKQIENILKTTTIVSNRIKMNIYLKDIIYIESGDHCTLLHAKDKVLKNSKKLNEFEKELCSNKQFIKCHQSYIINLNHATSFVDSKIIMDNGDHVLVSVRDASKIKKQFADFFWSLT